MMTSFLLIQLSHYDNIGQWKLSVAVWWRPKNLPRAGPKPDFCDYEELFYSVKKGEILSMAVAAVGAFTIEGFYNPKNFTTSVLMFLNRCFDILPFRERILFCETIFIW